MLFKKVCVTLKIPKTNGAFEMTNLDGNIALGRGAVATLPHEFVLNVELGEERGVYTTFRTVMSVEEHAHVAAVLARAVRTVPKCCEGGPQWGREWSCRALLNR